MPASAEYVGLVNQIDCGGREVLSSSRGSGSGSRALWKATVQLLQVEVVAVLAVLLVTLFARDYLAKSPWKVVKPQSVLTLLRQKNIILDLGIAIFHFLKYFKNEGVFFVIIFFLVGDRGLKRQ